MCPAEIPKTVKHPGHRGGASVWLREARHDIGDGYGEPYKGEDSDLDV
jgi:hypothetical protein